MNFKLILFLCFIGLSRFCFGQTAADVFKAKLLADSHLAKTEYKASMVVKNFSPIWTITDNSFIYGFIGANYQRIHIKFISVNKDNLHPYIYHVTGKSMVKNNICDFKGLLNVTNIRKYKQTSYGVDNEYKNKGIVGRYSIVGNYRFFEDSLQSHVGIFTGSFQSDFYLTDDGKAHYDNIENYADGYANNQFVGIWTSYDNKMIQVCNWGDYRVPNSGKLDIGAGEFSPADQYLQLGWRSVRDAYSQKIPSSAKAKKDENRIWWK